MNPERQIREYLLGVLPAEHREEIEQQILSDDDFHQEVEIEEEELLDDYVCGRLPEPDRQLFETNFLTSTLRQQRLRFARALQSKTSTSADAVRPPVHVSLGRFYPYALAASVLLAGFLGVVNYQYSKKIKEDRARLALLTQQVENASKSASQVAPNSIFLAELLPKASRSGPQPQFIVPKGVLAVRFSLVLPTNAEGPVKLDLLNDAGQIIISQQGIQIDRSEGKSSASATIESRYLNPGDYFLRVTSQQGAAVPEYAFQILRPNASVF